MSKNSLFAFILLVFLGAEAVVVLRRHAPEVAARPEPHPQPSPNVEEIAPRTEPDPVPVFAPPPAPVEHPAPQAVAAPKSIRAPVPAAPPNAQPPNVPVTDAGSIPVPVARYALSLVGADPEAEGVWADAINDPNMPAAARKDLIEDLNEEGFPDPKNITPDDLPLILNRIELIEAHAPLAMDDVNADAFAEAYKDLLKMLDKAMQ